MVGQDAPTTAVVPKPAPPVQAAQDAAKAPTRGYEADAGSSLLRRPEGVSGPHIAEVTGWTPHTVRGFLAGLARKGVRVTVLERVRQVGSGTQGVKGSYTVYHVGQAG